MADSPSPKSAKILKLLQQRAATGEKARKELIDELAKLKFEDLCRAPSIAFVRLGPAGIAELAKRRGDLALSELPQPKSRSDWKAALTLPTIPASWLYPVQAMGRVLWIPFAILFVAIVLDGAQPFWRPLIANPAISSAGSASACPRLASWVRSCRYRVGADDLTLRKIASLSAIPLDSLYAANMALRNIPPDSRLPAKTAISIPRD